MLSHVFRTSYKNGFVTDCGSSVTVMKINIRIEYHSFMSKVNNNMCTERLVEVIFLNRRFLTRFQTC